MKQYRILLACIALIPMVIYYITISFWSQFMATHFIWGIPFSILGGVISMLWGAFVALFYAIVHYFKKSFRQ